MSQTHQACQHCRKPEAEHDPAGHPFTPYEPSEEEEGQDNLQHLIRITVATILTLRFPGYGVDKALEEAEEIIQGSERMKRFHTK